MKGIIYLEDGTIYKGKGFGYEGTKVGEIVFNTGMTGYQKTLTDPSYKEQIITMTYPLMGNYGINDTDNESEGIHAFGMITKDICYKTTNWKCKKNIDEWLKDEKVPGVYDIDTREITRKIRSRGTMKCLITTEDLSLDSMKKIMGAVELNVDQMKTAGTEEVISLPASKCKFKVAVIDLGVKKSILKELNGRGCDLTIFPYGSPCSDILSINPDGIFITNGPGDPKAATETIKEVAKLIEKDLPVFGICMGHQILALALGGNTFKLKYGHRGCNHGVFDKNTGRSYITSQNHGYSVKGESIILKGLEITHLNLNDGTVEGMQHISKPIFSVQFHPESSPGPNDTGYLFDKFIALMEGGKN